MGTEYKVPSFFLLCIPVWFSFQGSTASTRTCPVHSFFFQREVLQSICAALLCPKSKMEDVTTAKGSASNKKEQRSETDNRKRGHQESEATDQVPSKKKEKMSSKSNETTLAKAKDKIEIQSFIDRIMDMQIRWSSNSCWIDAQIVLLYSLCLHNRKFLCRKLGSFIEKAKTSTRGGVLKVMNNLPLMTEIFQKKLTFKKGQTGSAGWMLDVLTDDLAFTFKINSPKDAARCLCIDRPFIIVDGLNSLKRFAHWTSSFNLTFGSICLKFRLKAICGIRDGHWETLVVPNSAGKCRPVKVDVTKKGPEIQSYSGGRFTESRDQLLYVYEMEGSLLQHPHYSFLHQTVTEYHRSKVIKFVTQTLEHDDTSVALRHLLEQCLKIAPMPYEQLSFRQLIQMFAPALEKNESLWKHLKTFCTYACIHDYTTVFHN